MMYEPAAGFLTHIHDSDTALKTPTRCGNKDFQQERGGICSNKSGAIAGEIFKTPIKLTRTSFFQSPPMSSAKRPRIDDAVLKRFAEGRLDSRAEAKMAILIEKSPDLQARVAAISGEDFLVRVREIATQSRGGFSSSPPKAKKPKPTSLVSMTEGIPVELQDATDYQILKELGRGGMGVVYAAKYLPMDRMEVLKVLNEQMVQKESARQRFESEMRAIGKLNHPFIATAYQQVPLPTQLVFSMEYVPGIDLHKFIGKYHPVPVPVACTLASQIATALQHAHKRGMVHRDIKPSNVMVHKEDGNLQIKILDFGLAKATSEQQTEGITAQGTMLGTPEYMAPEQALDAATADIRADIYSLGCTLYHLLAGRPPFTGTYQSILMAHAQKEADYVSFERLDVPVELSEVIAKMMAKDPSKRYDSPNQVAIALKPILGRTSLPQLSIEQQSGKTDTKLNLASASRDTSVEAPAEPKPVPIVQLIPVATPAVGNQGNLEVVLEEQPAVTVRRKSQPKRWSTPGFVLTAISAVSILLILFSGVMTVKTKHGTLVFENLPANASVSIDGERVTLTSDDGTTYELEVVAGERQIQVKNGDTILYGEKVAVASGKSKAIAISLERQILKAEVPAFVDSTPASDLNSATATESEIETALDFDGSVGLLVRTRGLREFLVRC